MWAPQQIKKGRDFRSNHDFAKAKANPNVSLKEVLEQIRPFSMEQSRATAAAQSEEFVNLATEEGMLMLKRYADSRGAG